MQQDRFTSFSDVHHPETLFVSITLRSQSIGLQDRTMAIQSLSPSTSPRDSVLAMSAARSWPPGVCLIGLYAV